MTESEFIKSQAAKIDRHACEFRMALQNAFMAGCASDIAQRDGEAIRALKWLEQKCRDHRADCDQEIRDALDQIDRVCAIKLAKPMEPGEVKALGEEITRQVDIQADLVAVGALPMAAVDLMRGVRLLMVAKPCLGDFVYQIRDSEMQGWEGHRVRAWGEGCGLIHDAMRRLDDRARKENA